MTKKKKNSSSNLHQIGVPKGCQQPRTRNHVPKRRTDFSHFLSSSHSSSSCTAHAHHRPHRGSTFEFSSCKNSCSSITTATVDRGCQASVLRLQEETPKFSLMRHSVSPNGGHKSSLNCREVTYTDVESRAQSAPPDTCDNWNNGGHITDHVSTFSSAEALPCTPNKSASQVAESGNVSIVPGCVVWAKTAHQPWWPAEVLGERASTNDQTLGRVLVQFYGSHDYAWVDPEGDLSHFEDCFEERSCNPTEMFQDALNRALHRKQHLTSCKQWDKSPDVLMNSNHQDQSPDKWNASSSSRVEDDYHGGRGKRKRKPKVHFDEVVFPVKSKKKGRRLRIMRYLGLVAPSGSPFTPASHMELEKQKESADMSESNSIQTHGKASFTRGGGSRFSAECKSLHKQAP